MPEMDSKLDDAMADIVQIMQENNIGGTVFLVSPTHARYAYEFPKWSCISMGKKGEEGMVKMNCKQEEFKTQADWANGLQLLAHFVHQIRDMTQNAAETFQMMVTQLQEYMEIDHEPGHNFKPGTGKEEDDD